VSEGDGLQPYYLSFADDDGWLGACLVRGADDGDVMANPDNPVSRAHQLGCNPGGEVMVMPLREDIAAQIAEEFWGILLSEDDLRALGAIVAPDEAGLVKGTPEEIEAGTAADYDG
jgi:hypothetical protein